MACSFLRNGSKKRVMREMRMYIPFQIGRLGAALTLNENTQKKKIDRKNIQNRWRSNLKKK